MKVRDWMTPCPKAIGHDARLQDARDLMDRGGFRHVPVVDGVGRLIGIVTDRDVREHHGHLRDTRVTAALVESPLTVARTIRSSTPPTSY
jgi:CBS domain-containing protein